MRRARCSSCGTSFEQGRGSLIIVRPPDGPPEPAAAVATESDDSDARLVRVLEDLPTFTGLDARNYSLRANDVAHIPTYNARILLEAGKVERLEGEA